MPSRSFFLICLLSVLVLIPLVTHGAQRSNEPINIACTTDNAPFSFTLPDGTKTGLYVEFWELWSETNNIPINIIMTSFEQTIELVKNKQAIHAGLFKNDTRKQWADFSYPIHNVKTGVLYNRKFSKDTKLDEMQGIRVASQIGSYQASYLKKTYPSLELTEYPDSEDIINQLLKDEIQAIVAEVPYLKALLAKHSLTGVLPIANEKILSNQVHAVIAKGQLELLNIINQGIDNIPIKTLVALEKKWLPTFEPFFKGAASFDALTIAEKKWLQKHHSFSLGIDNYWYPFDFVDDNGRYSGIAADYINYLEEKLDINIEPTLTNNWLESFEAFNDGKIDIMSAIIATTERSKSIIFTDAYFSVPTVIVTRKNSFYVDNMSGLNHRKLGLVKGFAFVEMVKKDYPDIEIVLLDSRVSALKKLNSGEIEAYLGNISIINFIIDKHKLTKINIAAFTKYRFKISMALSKENQPLAAIFNKAFSDMDEKQKTAITNNWLATHVQNGTDIKTIFLWGSPLLIFMIIVMITIVRFNRTLKMEISSRKEVEKELMHLAQHDALTGLPNWRLFEELSKLALSRAKRHQYQQALLFIDIDGFKNVNDSWGHSAGDRLLVLIAKRLSDCVRGSDIVARLGGDEFTIYLSDSCSTKDAKEIASKIVFKLSTPFDLEESQIKIGASIGISFYPNDATNIDTLIKNADIAMYVAKKFGKNGYRLFSES